MNRFRSYVQRVITLLAVVILLITGVLYAVSSFIVRRSYEQLSSAEMLAAVQDGTQMLSARNEGMPPEALRAALSPAFNPTGAFLVLLETDGRLIAASDTAEPYLDTLLSASVRLGDTPAAVRVSSLSGSVFLMGVRTANGAVIAGKSQLAYERSLERFRSLLRGWVLIPAIVLFLFSLYLSHIMSKPADVLVRAAQKLSGGELVQVGEKLPPDLKPIGRAFNDMSLRLGQIMGALRYERDTMQLVLQSLREGVIALDEAGDILHANRAAGELLGGQGSPLWQQIVSALRSGSSDTMRLQNGEHALLVTMNPLPGDEDQARGAVAMILDITEQERLQRTRREYVANISHELRTPLTSMRGIAEALRDGLVTGEEEKQRYYATIVAQVRRLSRLVSDLLELSSLQSNPAAFESEAVDAQALLYDMMDLTAPLAQKKELALALEAPEHLPFVRCNEDRLQQVLTILMDNAVKFTAEGTVTLGAEPVRGGVRFFVRDTGVGMDAFTCAHAFDRFHQADRSRRTGGSGLGLAIAQQIMTRMGTAITVDSTPGEGSTFSFTLPRDEG